MNSVKQPAAYASSQSCGSSANIWSRRERPRQNGMISRSYSAMTAGSTLYCVLGRESRMRRSSALWHVSSG